jgi:hypothetical protein
VSAELEESATSSTPQVSNAMASCVAVDLPTEVIVVVALTTVDVVSSPLGSGEPGHTVLLVVTLPPLPVPVEKQFTLVGVVLSSCRVPEENEFALLIACEEKDAHAAVAGTVTKTHRAATASGLIGRRRRGACLNRWSSPRSRSMLVGVPSCVCSGRTLSPSS